MFRKHRYLFLLIIWIISVIFLSLVSFPKTKIRPLFSHSDKIVHFVFYFVMTLLLMRFFKIETSWFKTFRLRAIVSFVIVFVLGVLIEFLQEKITLYRSGDIKDIYFNTFGIIVAIYLLRMTRF
ncbi:VanZ family protein [Capnocytophaga catalasegens]